jgi:hypothetical protein
VTFETPVIPRLMDMRSAAQYLGISAWTLRELVLARQVPAVRSPSPLGKKRSLRRVLIDRLDLDAAVESWKQGAGANPSKYEADSPRARRTVG